MWGLFVSLAVAAWNVSADEKAATQVDADTNGDIVIGPDYKLDPDLTDQGNPKGQKFEFAMKLADSKIFKGDDKTLDPRKRVRKERKIWVYVPAAYKDGTKAPILVTLDGPSQLKLVQNAVDWTLADGDLLAIRARAGAARAIEVEPDQRGKWRNVNLALAFVFLGVVVGIATLRRRTVKSVMGGR